MLGADEPATALEAAREERKLLRTACAQRDGGHAGADPLGPLAVLGDALLALVDVLLVSLDA